VNEAWGAVDLSSACGPGDPGFAAGGGPVSDGLFCSLKKPPCIQYVLASTILYYYAKSSDSVRFSQPIHATVQNHAGLRSSVTQAARNFADCVNRVHYQNMTFVLLKNGVPFFRLTPDDHRECTGRRLAGVLGGARLTSSEARAWRGK
jgi:hypothetical protein